MKKLALWLSFTGVLALAAFDQRGPSGESGDGMLSGARDQADLPPHLEVLIVPRFALIDLSHDSVRSCGNCQHDRYEIYTDHCPDVGHAYPSPTIGHSDLWYNQDAYMVAEPQSLYTYNTY